MFPPNFFKLFLFQNLCSMFMILVWHLWLQRNIFIVFVCSSFSFYILIYGRTQSFMFLQEENTRDFDAWIATVNFEDVNCCTCHPQAVKYPGTFAVYRNSLSQTVLIFKLQLLSWVSHAEDPRCVCNFYIYNIRLFRNDFLSHLFLIVYFTSISTIFSHWCNLKTVSFEMMAGESFKVTNLRKAHFQGKLLVPHLS